MNSTPQSLTQSLTWSLSHPLTRTACLMALVAASLNLAGCEVLAVGALAGGSSAVAVDRRTAGIQLEDKTIEIKIGQRAKELFADRAAVNATSYNRMVLLTGQVANQADRAAAEEAARAVENVKSVINDLVVGIPSSLTSRAADSVITGKVRASFIDAKDLSSTAFKVVTENGAVYLMGMVTEEESKRATQLAAGVSGVTKVVRALEIITPEQLLKLRGRADGTR